MSSRRTLKAVTVPRGIWQAIPDERELPGFFPDEDAALVGYSTDEDAFGTKSIGLFGGVMLLTNNLAGPTISLMPSLFQEAGWLNVVATMLILACISAACGYMLLATMQAIPGNQRLERRVEYADVLKYFLPMGLYVPTMVCYFGYLVLTLMSYVIQTVQVLDYASLNYLGCAYGLELWPRFMHGLCGVEESSVTPYGSDVVVFSSSFLLLIVVCAPFAWRNLDDNICLQVVAILGLTVLATIWICFLTRQPGFPREIPPVRSSNGSAIGILLFNFAMMSALPSWANEKCEGVSLGWSLFLSIGYVVVVYSAVGMVGAAAYAPFYHGDENLFSKLNASGSLLARCTVEVYPIVQNLTSIPVFAIFIKYNLMRLTHLGPFASSLLAFASPLVLSVPFYTGRGFEHVANFGGMAFSSVINFVAPALVYMRAQRLLASCMQFCDAP